MKHLNVVAMIVWLFLPAEALAQSQQTSGIEPIRAVNQQLVSAIGARDIDAMDKVWAHEAYASLNRLSRASSSLACRHIASRHATAGHAEAR